MKDNNRIIVFDTTLRDGEQSPGASLTGDAKIKIARQLAKLGVDVIEAGFPVSSPGQFEAVKSIAEESPCIVAALARAKDDDIRAAGEALRPARRARIHTFIGTSDHHILGKFASDRYGVSLTEKRATVLKMAQDAIRYAREFVPEVEFSAEDAFRTDIGYLKEIAAAALEAGATTINLPDTTGFAHPTHYAQVFAQLLREVPGLDRAVLSSHCHDDLGLAVANTLAAVHAGARQVECTINGIGERAGNASLEEIVMALRVRSDFYNFTTGVNTQEILETSRMVSQLTGMPVQPNKAIVGANAFAHESGIHQDGMLKSRDTYEIMDPSVVGVSRSKLVLGKHSGQHGLKARLKELGYELNEDQLKEVYMDFLDFAEDRKEVTDQDLHTLMSAPTARAEDCRLELMQVTTGTVSLPTASVIVRRGDQALKGSAIGEGPVEACFTAAEAALGVKPELESYSVRSMSSGVKSKAEATVTLRDGDRTFQGRGVSIDVLEASLHAWLDAFNRLSAYKRVRREGEWQRYTKDMPTSLAW